MLKTGTPEGTQRKAAPAESILKRPSLPRSVKERLDSPGGPKLKIDEGRIQGQQREEMKLKKNEVEVTQQELSTIVTLVAGLDHTHYVDADVQAVILKLRSAHNDDKSLFLRLR